MALRVVSFLLLWTVILNWRSSMTEFVSSRLCLIVFKTFSDRSGIRTHAHTRVPEFSTEEFLESGALDRSAILPGLLWPFSVWSVLFQWGNFSIQRFNLLNGWCHPFEKFFVQTHVYFRVSHVFAGYLLLCAFLNCSAINHPMTLRVVCFVLLWTVILNWRSSMTEFVSWGLCLIVFKTFSDRSGIRTHAHTRVPEFSTEGCLESGALDRSGILPGLRRPTSFCCVSFQLSDNFNS